MADTKNPLEGFKILKVKYTESSTAVRQIFVKQHLVRTVEPTKPSDRTLFCANIPPWMHYTILKTILQKYGDVEAVYMEFEPNSGPPTPMPDFDELFPPARDPYATGNGFKYAYVVYKRSSSLRECLTSLETEKELIASTPEKPVYSGVKKWNSQYNRKLRQRQDVLDEVEDYMKTYDENKEKEFRKDKEMEEPDEEGWVTVTKTQKFNKGLKRRTESELMEEQQRYRGPKGKRLKKKKDRELLHFYNHQLKDDKLKKIRELREKFEQDKLKISQMKADRKFRPF